MPGKQQLGQQSAAETVIAAVVIEMLVVTVTAAIVEHGEITLLTLYSTNRT